MEKLAALLCVFILLGLCSTALAMELDLDKFMPVDEIKPGMKGVGKTVFKGTQIEEFQIEVLHVSKNFNGPKGDVIWALCSGGPLEETGVLSGMSGSPVYIDGRMIGAVAYRMGSFPKRPVAGITAIADMLNILEKSGTEISQSMIDDRHTETISNLLASKTEENIEPPELSIQDDTVSITPIHMPVVVSGLHPKTVEEMAPVFKNLGMALVQGGGSSAHDESAESTFVPGSVVGVQFVRGDATSFGFGTLTYIEDNKALGFGHPMYGTGETSLPMVGGHVGLLVSSMLASSKLAAPTEVMGTLTYDSNYGIMGVIGKQPEFIPLKIKLNSQEYNFEIAKHKLYSTTYIYMMALNSIYSAEKTSGDYTMQTHSEIKLKGHPVIIQENIFSGTSPGTAASAFAAPIFALMRNRFEEVDIESVSLEMSFKNERVNAAIEGIRLNKDRVKPGGSVTATLFLAPYLKDSVTQQVKINVPSDMPEGPTLLRLSDVAASDTWERSRAPMKARITDLPHLIQVIREEERNDNIIIELFTPQLGITIDDQELPALPLTAFSVMSSSKHAGGSGVTRGTTFSKQRVQTDYVISGSAIMLLNIDQDAP